MDRVVVTNLSALGDWDKVRVGFALKGLNRILELPAFKLAVLDAKFTETNGLSNLQVYEKIMEGDQLSPLDKKGVLDIQVVLYRKAWSRVVGYTYENGLTIWVNRKYFGDARSIASNLLHESTHQLGFYHNSVWASSVPYTMNRIVEDLWKVYCQDVTKEYNDWWNS